jgi:hypothetical protein
MKKSIVKLTMTSVCKVRGLVHAFRSPSPAFPVQQSLAQQTEILWTYSKIFSNGI